MNDFIERAKVITSAAVTWLTFTALVLTVAADEIGQLAPDGTGQDVTTFLIRVAAWLGAAVSIIRRVTPVAPDERGILEE